MSDPLKNKICYISTLPDTMRFFNVKSAIYNHEAGGLAITIICSDDGRIGNELPASIRYVPIKIKRGYSLSGIVSLIILYKHFKKEKYDLIQYSTGNASCYASVAGRLAHIPVRLYTQWGIDYPYLSGMKKLLMKIIEMTICSNSTNCQPDSFGNLELAIADHLYDAQKGEVIGNGSAAGIDFDKFNIRQKDAWRQETRAKFGITEKEFVFGYTGRILAQKGMNELFQAMMTLRDADFIKLIIVGEDKFDRDIRPDLMAWVKSDSRVIFTGFTNETERYYAAMDVFLFPSYHEGFGSVIIEAEAMSVPAVTSNVPGPSEAIIDGETGYLIPPKDSEALIHKMKEMMSDREKTKTMGAEAYHYVKEKYDQRELFKAIYENRMRLLGVNRNC